MQMAGNMTQYLTSNHIKCTQYIMSTDVTKKEWKDIYVGDINPLVTYAWKD